MNGEVILDLMSDTQFEDCSCLIYREEGTVHSIPRKAETKFISGFFILTEELNEIWIKRSKMFYDKLTLDSVNKTLLRKR